MTSAQRKAHARLLAALGVRIHFRMTAQEARGDLQRGPKMAPRHRPQALTIKSGPRRN